MTPAVHLEADAFFRFIRSGYIEPWRPESHEQNSLVMSIVAKAAAAYAAAGYFTIVDGIIIPRWFLRPLQEVISAMRLEVAYAVLRAPRAVCAARLETREGVGLPDRAVLDQLWSEFADLGPFEKNVVEVRAEQASEVADEVARLLADGQLTI